jgi:hypothetical protein
MSETRLFRDVQIHPTRICGFLVGYDEDGSERICAEPAVIHVVIEYTDPIDALFACNEHREALLETGYYHYHDMGSCCGMPGARWIVKADDSTECVCEDLPTVEGQREDLSGSKR